MTTFRTYIQVVCALFIILLIPTWGWCVPTGTVISNTAQVTYDSGSATGIVLLSNTVTSVTEIIRTPSALEYLQYAQAAPGAELVTVPITEYSTSGTDAGPFVQLPPPAPLGSSLPINLSNPVPLVPASLFHQGEPVFLRLTDQDQNLDPLVAETVLVTVSVGPLGERELLRLKETDLNSGVFAGYIQSAGNPPPATANDGILGVVEECEVISDYVDVADGGDISSSTVLVFKPEQVRCEGCRGSISAHWSPDCKMVLCTRKRGLQYCFRCKDFPCTIVNKFSSDGISHHKRTIENSKRMKEIGIEVWIEEQKRKGQCPFCP